MSDTQGDAALPGQVDEPVELPGDSLRITVIVQEHVPAGGGNAVSFRHRCGNRTGGGAAVHEVQVAAIAQRAHQPPHVLRIGGEQAAHVIAHPDGERDVSQCVQECLHQLAAAHVLGQSVRPQRLVLLGLHGQMQHDLLVVGVGDPGQLSGIRSMGKK